MVHRVLTVLRARLTAYGGTERAPVAALLLQALAAAVLCGLVRAELPPFAYGLFALTLSGTLVAIPLLGELSRLLVADEAGEWVRALPITPRELRLARTLHLLIALFTLALGSLLPAAALAPAGTGLIGRALLVVGGLEQALALAAVLLLVQAVLRGRARPLLVALQTALFVGVLVGAALGTRAVPALRHLTSPDQIAGLAAWPQAWFAAPLAAGATAGWLLAGPAAALAAILLLALLPEPPDEPERRGEPLLARLLAPARLLARRLWVRDDERASFELVFDALPRERSFVLRAYPLVAVPLAFLALGARQESGVGAEGLYALLCFTTAAYLPLVAAHVPASDSAAARWLLDTAPVPRSALEAGALKAVVVRLVLPLYALLTLLCWSQGGWLLALRLGLPGALAAVLVLRLTWHRCVPDLPLSVDPDELAVELDWLGLLGGLGIGLTVVAVLVVRNVGDAPAALTLAAVLLAAELVLDRAWRRTRPREDVPEQAP
jgi:hypothetical protein